MEVVQPLEPVVEELKKPFVSSNVYAVGTLKPEFDLNSKQFIPPQLKVRGTGFWLQHPQAFITCAHVVADVVQAPIEVTGMLVVGGNGAPYLKATVSVLDFEHDLAVLNVEGNKNFLNQQSQNGFELVDQQIEVGEKIAYAGFPFGNLLLNEMHTPAYAEGVIGTDILEKGGPKFIQISGPIAGGYSGAPIVLQKDSKKVLAVVANSPSKEVGDASIFRGIHWSHIKAILSLVQS